MPEIGAYEAKTHLPQLLKRIQEGEHFVITKHGKAVAKLIPASRADPEAIQQTISNIRSFRETLRKQGVHIQEWLKKDEQLRDLSHQEHRY